MIQESKGDDSEISVQNQRKFRLLLSRPKKGFLLKL